MCIAHVLMFVLILLPLLVTLVIVPVLVPASVLVKFFCHSERHKRQSSRRAAIPGHILALCAYPLCKYLQLVRHVYECLTHSGYAPNVRLS